MKEFLNITVDGKLVVTLSWNGDQAIISRTEILELAPREIDTIIEALSYARDLSQKRIDKELPF